MSQYADNAHGGLQFFGRISASVSHEIKNVFAVINEAAGLIQDFTIMAERGMPLQPERLKSVAGTIQGQIRRGDGIVKNMNAFAHSTDEPVRKVDLVETLALTKALTDRLADMNQVTLTLEDCASVSVVTNPFDLIQLLHSSMAAAFESMQPGDVLAVGVKSENGGASFSLSVPGKDAPLTSVDAFSTLAGAMGATVRVNEEKGISELLLPSS